MSQNVIYWRKKQKKSVNIPMGPSVPAGLEIGPRGPSVCWSKCAKGSRDLAQGSKYVGVQLWQIAQESKDSK